MLSLQRGFSIPASIGRELYNKCIFRLNLKCDLKLNFEFHFKFNFKFKSIRQPLVATEGL